MVKRIFAYHMHNQYDTNNAFKQNSSVQNNLSLKIHFSNKNIKITFFAKECKSLVI